MSTTIETLESDIRAAHEQNDWASIRKFSLQVMELIENDIQKAMTQDDFDSAFDLFVTHQMYDVALERGVFLDSIYGNFSKAIEENDFETAKSSLGQYMQEFMKEIKKSVAAKEFRRASILAGELDELRKQIVEIAEADNGNAMNQCSLPDGVHCPDKEWPDCGYESCPYHADSDDGKDNEEAKETNGEETVIG